MRDGSGLFAARVRTAMSWVVVGCAAAVAAAVVAHLWT